MSVTGIFRHLQRQQRVSAHCLCGPLTFNINGEIIISPSAGQLCPAIVTCSRLLAHLFILS